MRFAAASAALAAALLAGLLSGPTAGAQTLGQKEEFTAAAVVVNEFGSGSGMVEMRVERWSTEAERKTLVDALLQKGPEKLLDSLADMRSVGRIRTPDSIGYDLRYAHQTKTEEGGRRIVLATDRPIGFWEATRRPRTIDYPFTVVQMQFDREGKGTGTLSVATRIRAKDGVIELENFATAPVMLSDIESRPID